jgi:glycerol-3-phosphate dehydrogenase
MRHLQTEVLVIGGGATGAGIARDLAMRGFKIILVEKGDLATGTTGRYHGLLHSGGRYVVKDPQAAAECIVENRILRRILPHCIEDTGGYFVLTPWDDAEYVPMFLDGCRKAGIPIEEVTVSQMLREEPLLNPHIRQCFRVPDAAADSFQATEANILSAKLHGAQVYLYHQVEKLILTGQDVGDQRVTGGICHDLVGDEEVRVDANMVVNASGAWAGQIAQMAGIDFHVIPGKGTMLAMNHRILNTVINRCKLPSDGDIIVPIHTVTVLGTTDIPVIDPDHFAIEPWEVRLLMDEGEKVLPGIKNMRVLRAWAGVRPLYHEADVDDTRDVTRAYVLLDHEKTDGVAGIVSITSGKWTTFRKMAEATADLVCTQLKVQRACRTHLEVLPGGEGSGYHYLGARLQQLESRPTPSTGSPLVCECELATYDDVLDSIIENEARTIDDIRRDVRLGMGPCQGGFCTYRVTGILHATQRMSIEDANVSLRDFLQERWKGLLPILWGQQLRQERLDELIYLSVLNLDHLPGPRASQLQAIPYEPPDWQAIAPHPDIAEDGEQTQASQHIQAAPARPPDSIYGEVDVLVIGAGLAGLTAAWQACETGNRTRLIAKGWGSLYTHTGCIDVLGYFPPLADHPVTSPAQSIQRLLVEQPEHPYSLAGIQSLDEALRSLQDLSKRSGYPLHGSLDRNWLLPSALGSIRPTCLAPETMTAGDLQDKTPMVIVGFKEFVDFYPDLVAANLQAQGYPVEAIILDLDGLLDRRSRHPRYLAETFDQADFRENLAGLLRDGLKIKGIGNARYRVGFPALLGIVQPVEAMRHLADLLGGPVFEIPTLPPSIPGMRLSRILYEAIERIGGRCYLGMRATGKVTEGDRIVSVQSEAAPRRISHRARRFILATGGFLGGGLEAGYDASPQETVFGLNVQGPGLREGWFEREFLSPRGHPLFRAGIGTGQDFKPRGSDLEPTYTNLSVVGGALAGTDSISERSLEGIALVSGYLAGRYESMDQWSGRG